MNEQERKPLADYTLREIQNICAGNHQPCEHCPFDRECDCLFNVSPYYWGNIIDENGNE